MSASATTAIVVVVMLVIAALMIATLVVASAAITTAAATCHMLNQVLNLLVGSLAVLNHLTLKVQGFACQWVVGVDSNAVFLNLNNLGHELVILVVHQGDNGSLEDVIVVEMAVNGKYLAAYLVNTLDYVLAKSLGWCQLEIKAAALLKTLYLLLESIECYTKAGDELERTIVASLLLELALAILQAVQLVYNRHESVFCFFHYTYYIYIIIFSLQSYAFSAKYTNV